MNNLFSHFFIVNFKDSFLYDFKESFFFDLPISIHSSLVSFDNYSGVDLETTLDK